MFYKILLLIASLFSFKEEPQFNETVRVMSFNILWDEDSEHCWEARKSAVASMIRFHRADLIGLQEASSEQIKDLEKALPEYGIIQGIYNPILFRKSLFKPITSGSFYLSSTPDQASLGWDAKFPRSVCWVKLLDKKRGEEFLFFNTHFDYHGTVARDQSVQLLQNKVSEIAARSPFVIAGDFNLFPDLGGEKTYSMLNTTFFDAQRLTLFPHHGPTGTWSGFKEAGQPGVKPDCIFVSPNVDVYLHGVLSDTFDGQFPSDHLPVVADLIILK